MRMVTLRELAAAFRDTWDDMFIDEASPTYVPKDAVVVLVVENLGGLVDAELRRRGGDGAAVTAAELAGMTAAEIAMLESGNKRATPKSAEALLPDLRLNFPSDRADPLIFDLALAERNGGRDAPEAIAALLRVAGDRPTVFVVVNDGVYAASQQPKHIRQLIKWIDGDGSSEGRSGAIRIHLAIGFTLYIGRERIEAMIRKQATAEIAITYHAGLELDPEYVPGQVLLQAKVPDSIVPKGIEDKEELELFEAFESALNAMLGPYREIYRSSACVAEAIKCLDAARGGCCVL
jgi:hypothetical protein